MSEPMTVRPEIWPVAADQTGPYLLSGIEPWRLAAVPADTTIHFEVELELHPDIGPHNLEVLHSTSWYQDGPALIVAYLAVVRCPALLVRDTWPQAKPIDMRVAELVGPPPTHGAAEQPVVRRWDVLLHALRHLAFLRYTDAEVSRALDDTWHEVLGRVEPVLAGMYGQPHSA